MGSVFMSRIESIKNYSPKNLNFVSKQSFTSSAISSETINKIAKEIAPGVETTINKSMPIISRISALLAKHDGELQNQVINMAFTTTLAPTFIAWNPFSKQDEKTKKFAAARQPISAVIAILGGYPITTAINSYMNKMGSVGYHESIDLRMKPNESYLKYLHKKYKGMLNGEKYNLKDFIDTKQKERTNLFTSLISENPAHIKIEEGTGAISVLKNGKHVELGRNITNLGTQAELDRYLQKHNLYNVKFSDFMRDEFKFEFFNDGGIKPHTINKKLGSVKTIDFLRQLGIVTKKDFSESDLHEFISRARQNAKAVDVIKHAHKSGALQATGAAELAEEISKTATRVVQTVVGENVAKTEAHTLGQFFERFDYHGARLQELMDSSMVTVLNEMKEYFQESGMKKFDANATIQDFAKNLMHNRIAKTESYFKGFKLFAGIGFNLFTTAVTCTALNWAYPRIIERFFPSLVKDDIPNDKSKTQQSEIKKGGNK